MGPKLPPEILTLAMHYLLEDRKALARCTLVARGWRAPAQWLLFQRLTIRRFGVDEVPWIESVLPVVQRFLPHIKTLVAVLGEDDIAEDWNAILEHLIPLCPNAYALECLFWDADIQENEPLLLGLQHAMPAILELTIVGMWFADPESCFAVRARSKNLSRLTLDRCFLQEEHEGFEASDWEGQDVADNWKAQIDEALPSLPTPALTIRESDSDVIMSLLPWLAGPDLRSLDVPFYHDKSELMKITTTKHAATLVELRLDIHSDHPYGEAISGFHDHGVFHMYLSQWIPTKNQIAELTLAVFSVTELQSLVFDVQFPHLHTLCILVKVARHALVKDPPDLLGSLALSASLRVVSLTILKQSNGTWDDSVLKLFASAAERGILRIRLVDKYLL